MKAPTPDNPYSLDENVVVRFPDKTTVRYGAQSVDVEAGDRVTLVDDRLHLVAATSPPEES